MVGKAQSFRWFRPEPEPTSRQLVGRKYDLFALILLACAASPASAQEVPLNAGAVRAAVEELARKALASNPAAATVLLARRWERLIPLGGFYFFCPL